MHLFVGGFFIVAGSVAVPQRLSFYVLARLSELPSDRCRTVATVVQNERSCLDIVGAGYLCEWVLLRHPFVWCKGSRGLFAKRSCIIAS